MKYFLSYASEDLDVAEEVHLALLGAGHEVFFDKSAIKVGENYIEQIAKGIDDSDGFIFLISPGSVSDGSFTLTELRLAREKWPHPNKQVLPICIKAVDYKSIPPYLRAVAILEPEGNVAAEVVAALGRLRSRSERIYPAPAILQWLLLVLATILLALGLGTMFSFSYPRVTVDLSVTFVIILASAAIVFTARGIWNKFSRADRDE